MSRWISSAYRKSRSKAWGASRQRLARLGLAAGLLAGVAGCKARIVLPPAEESGEQLYLDRCATCHGRDGTGDGPVAAALKTSPSDLTTLSLRNEGVFPREQVIQMLTGKRSVPAHGSRAMPIWRERFEPSGTGATAAASIYAARRLELITDYLESIQRDAQ